MSYRSETGNSFHKREEERQRERGGRGGGEREGKEEGEREERGREREGREEEDILMKCLWVSTLWDKAHSCKSVDEEVVLTVVRSAVLLTFCKHHKL